MKVAACTAMLALGAILLIAHHPAASAVSIPAPISIPFELGQRITVPVMLEGRSIKAIIDSGSSGVIIDSDLAAEVKLKTGRSKLVNGEKVATAKVIYRLGEAAMTDASATVMSLKALSLTDPPAQMVIGRPLLRRFVVEFDFDNRLLKLHPPKGFVPPASPAVKLKLWSMLPELPIAVGEAPPVMALIDTGNPGSILLPSSYATGLGIDASRDARTTEYFGANTSGTQRLVKLDRLHIAGVELAGVPARVLPPGEKVFSETNIGLGVLKRFHVWIDFNNGTAWMVPGSAFSAPFPRQIGLSYRKTDEGLAVTGALAGSAAERAGLKVGDLIVSIDDAKGADAMLALISASNEGGGRRLQFGLAGGRSLIVEPGELAP